ncbi:protein G12-like isoform X2 [Uranotaenia lowii]|uniref:protein G12-like isoform X2 n=1 Tax=Uranotaenia lowii TaxID=190385 RepID=UPI00247A8E53|nr:protein G12-like isoform X2 [Uranotaenia lowii]
MKKGTFRHSLATIQPTRPKIRMGLPATTTTLLALFGTILSMSSQIFADQLLPPGVIPFPVQRHIQEQPSHQLQQDIMDFIDLVPFDDVHSLMQYYYHYDPEVESAFDYVSSEDYSQIKVEIMKLNEVRDFRRYLDGIGFSVEVVWKELTERFQVDDIFAEPDDSIRSLNLTTHGLNGMVDDILALLPQDEIILLFFDKLETSNDFSYFFEQIGSGEFENVLNMLQSSQQLRTLLWRLQRHGFDIPGWIQQIQSVNSLIASGMSTSSPNH